MRIAAAWVKLKAAVHSALHKVVAEIGQFILVVDETDSATASSHMMLALDKTMTEVAATTDRAQHDLGKSLSDTVTATDDLDGTASIQDDQEMQFVKATSHQALAADTVSVAFGRGFVHAAAFADAIARQAAFQRAYSDTSRTTDAVSNGLGKGIGAYALDYFGQDFVDNHAVGATDVLSRSLGAVRADSARISATGLLTWQSFGADYFQGDYVGAAQTF